MTSFDKRKRIFEKQRQAFEKFVAAREKFEKKAEAIRNDLTLFEKEIKRVSRLCFDAKNKGDI